MIRLDNKGWEYWWQEWIKPILVAAVLAFFIRTFVAQPFKIPSNSMYPTLKPGDRIFVNKYVYGARIPLTDIRFPKLADPKPGDIVVFTSPVEKNKFLVKRFIAEGGQSLQIKDGGIYVNGKRIETPPINKIFYYSRGEYGEEDKTIEIPKGYFYVLGDNSPNSMDSRYWGFVPEKNLVGKAFVIHWPLNRIRLIKDGE